MRQIPIGIGTKRSSRWISIADAVRRYPKRSLYKHAIIKVGRTNDLERRCEELNWGFPPGADLEWKAINRQKFHSSVDAHDAEQRLLTYVQDRGWTIGKEFAIVPERELDSLIAHVAERSAFVIKAGKPTPVATEL